MAKVRRCHVSVSFCISRLQSCSGWLSNETDTCSFFHIGVSASISSVAILISCHPSHWCELRDKACGTSLKSQSARRSSICATLWAYLCLYTSAICRFHHDVSFHLRGLKKSEGETWYFHFWYRQHTVWQYNCTQRTNALCLLIGLGRIHTGSRIRNATAICKQHTARYFPSSWSRRLIL